MNRKIIALNIVLLAVVIFAGVQLRSEWLAAKARESRTLQKPAVKAPIVMPYTKLPVADPVLSAGYNPIAQRFLLDPSRNPNVPIEAPPPPPPPPPMPPLPRYHGQMNLGGVTVILSETANGPQKSVKPGEAIGQFKLVDVSTEEIVFEWNGGLIRRTPGELTDRGDGDSSSGSSGSRPSGSASAQAPPPPPPAPVIKTPTGPGEAAPQGFRVCNPNDSTPEGAVVDGFRKTSYATPFGSACRWDPVK